MGIWGLVLPVSGKITSRKEIRKIIISDKRNLFRVFAEDDKGIEVVIVDFSVVKVDRMAT